MSSGTPQQKLLSFQNQIAAATSTPSTPTSAIGVARMQDNQRKKVHLITNRTAETTLTPDTSTVIATGQTASHTAVIVRAGTQNIAVTTDGSTPSATNGIQIAGGTVAGIAIAPSASVRVINLTAGGVVGYQFGVMRVPQPPRMGPV